MIPADEMYLEDAAADVSSPRVAVIERSNLTAEGAVRMDSIEAAIDAIGRGEAVIVVDDDLQAEWLKLVPGQQALPVEAAPWQGLSIVCCT